jgi:hypothetical protein
MTRRVDSIRDLVHNSVGKYHEARAQSAEQAKGFMHGLGAYSYAAYKAECISRGAWARGVGPGASEGRGGKMVWSCDDMMLVRIAS